MSKLMNSVKKHGVLTLLGLLVLAYALKQFSTRKGNSLEGNRNNYASSIEDSGPSEQNVDTLEHSNNRGNDPSPSTGDNDSTPSSVSGIQTSSAQGLPPSCSAQQVVDPKELLPKNTEWSNLNPQGSGDLQQVNLLKAGHHAGINTVGNTLRNANLQLRAEPPNPQTSVSPWMNTTIEPDLMRVPIDMGCAGA